VPLIDIDAFVKKYFIPAAPPDLVAGQWVRTFTTWLFNLARNIIVLGGLKYVADKTNSIYAVAAYNIGLMTLFMFAATYWQSFYFVVFENISKRRWAMVADGALNVTFGMIVTFGSYGVMSAVTAALARFR
jgi:hypothetical protein